MQISNNFVNSCSKAQKAQSFGTIHLATNETFGRMLELSQDSFVGSRFKDSFKELLEVSDKLGVDVQIGEVNNGCCVKKVDPKTKECIEILSTNVKDFAYGLREAALKLTKNK